MSKPPTFIVDDMQGDKPKPHPPDNPVHPPAKEDLGGGDICSPEQEAPTDDDKPLD